MPTTTNNGWPTPADTDLVKNGADAIRDLGQAIDTTLGVYAPSTPGLTLINTTSFSGVLSQQINSVFSTTYDNYRIIIKIASMVGGQDDLIGFQFGTSGSINTNANYRRSLQEILTNGVVSSINATDNQVNIFIAQMNVYGQIIVDIGSPFLSERTWIKSTCDTSDRTLQMSTNFFDGTTSFTDFKFYKDSATSITGTVSTYGYSK
jgi:hypothetical protein